MAEAGTKNQGLELWIGTKAADATGDTFVQVKRATMVGELGPDAPIIDATALEDSAKQKLKGIPDNGDIEITARRVYTDTGQNNLKAAAADTDDDPYNFRIRLPGAGASGANIQYSFKAIVATCRDVPGQVDNLIEQKSKLAVTGAITQGTYT